MKRKKKRALFLHLSLNFWPQKKKNNKKQKKSESLLNKRFCSSTDALDPRLVQIGPFSKKYHHTIKSNVKINYNDVVTFSFANGFCLKVKFKSVKRYLSWTQIYSLKDDSERTKMYVFKCGFRFLSLFRLNTTKIAILNTIWHWSSLWPAKLVGNPQTR